MIRNCIFLCKSLGISYLLTKFPDSRHVQLAIYTVFHEESESAVRIDQFLHPEEKTKKKQPTRVSISYRKISYHTSPPYFWTKFEVSRHMEVCPRRIFACRIRFCGQTQPIPSTKPEKSGYKIQENKKLLYRILLEPYQNLLEPYQNP